MALVLTGIAVIYRDLRNLRDELHEDTQDLQERLCTIETRLVKLEVRPRLETARR